MTRVLCITTKLSAGGVQTFLVSYARYLLKCGVMLDFAVQTSQEQLYDSELKRLGCRIYPICSYSKSKFSFFKDIYSLLKKNKEYKIVHSHLNYLNALPLFAAYIARCPVRISHSHSNYKASGLYARIGRVFVRKFIALFATDFWACSIDSAKWLYGNKFKNAIVIRNAVDFNLYAYNNDVRNKFRNLLGIDNEQLVWIHVGSYSRVKNHYFLLTLFKDYLTVQNNAKLLLCGDGELKQDVDDRIRELGLEDNVIQLGNRKNVSDYLNAADIFIFPSLFEGLPFSLIEAQATGLPVVVSNAITEEALFGNWYKCETFNKMEWINKILRVEYLDRTSDKNGLNLMYDLEVQSKYLADLYKARI